MEYVSEWGLFKEDSIPSVYDHASHMPGKSNSLKTGGQDDHCLHIRLTLTVFVTLSNAV